MTRLEILEASLAKKQAAFTDDVDEHFKTVASANAQPVSGKRNGHLVLKQNEALRNKQSGIERTKEAIEREKSKIARIERQQFPACIQELIDNGTLTIWRKYPHILFVTGMKKVRIHWDEKKNKVFASYFRELPKMQFESFKDLINGLQDKIDKELGI